MGIASTIAPRAAEGMFVFGVPSAFHERPRDAVNWL
jgi:hypothetical protein